MSDYPTSDEIPTYKQGFACIDGEFLPAAEATVSIFDHSFLYGDGVFESIVCRKGRLFALEPHLDRLAASCQYLQLNLPYTHEQLEHQIVELLERNGLADGFVRVIVSRGEGYPVSDPRKAQTPSVIISVQGGPAITRSRDTGVKLAIASTRRIPPICLEPRVKSNNYLNHIVAKIEAIGAGAEDAILLDVDGYVAELPVANIFVRHGNVLSTPPSHGILAGITRETVMKLVAAGAAGRDISVEARPMAPYDLFTAEEIFIVGTGTGVAFVEQIDGRTIGDGKAGPITSALMEAYDDLLDSGDGAVSTSPSTSSALSA